MKFIIKGPIYSNRNQNQIVRPIKWWRRRRCCMEMMTQSTVECVYTVYWTDRCSCLISPGDSFYRFSNRITIYIVVVVVSFVIIQSDTWYVLSSSSFFVLCLLHRKGAEANASTFYIVLVPGQGRITVVNGNKRNKEKNWSRLVFIGHWQMHIDLPRCRRFVGVRKWDRPFFAPPHSNSNEHDRVAMSRWPNSEFAIVGQVGRLLEWLGEMCGNVSHE